MRGFVPGLLLLAAAGCHGQLGDRTTKKETDLRNFAEARQRAATYYDGKDFERAAAQYKQALEYRPDHLPTRMGYAYSLMYMNKPSSLVEAKTEFEDLRVQRDPKLEVKRVFGNALTSRGLATHYDRRAMLRGNRGEVRGAAEDAREARKHAAEGIKGFRRVIELDEALAENQQDAMFRVSASLTPDAHVGIAHCEILLFDRDKPEELAGHLARAEENLQTFAQIAANARRFWEQRRERLLVLDPLEDRQSSARVTDPLERARYEERIANTIRQEVTVRRLMFETMLYANRYEDAIAEATTILRLDPAVDEVLLLRGRAYTWLVPPDYRAALRDFREYRQRLPRDRLTDELVKLNQQIKDLEKRVSEG